MSTLPQVNAKRKARQYRRNVTGPWVGIDHAQIVRGHECACWGHGCDGPIQAAHAIARGMGGAKGDWSVQVPLCAKHHRIYDEQFANQADFLLDGLGIDLMALAYKLAHSTYELQLLRCTNEREKELALADFEASLIVERRAA